MAPAMWLAMFISISVTLSFFRGSIYFLFFKKKNFLKIKSTPKLIFTWNW